jgi:hypothetical protein
LIGSAYLATELSTPQLSNSKKDALGLHCKAVICTCRVSRWNTIKQDRDVDQQFWTSTQEETKKFLNKSCTEKGKSYDEIKPNFSNVGAGKIVSKSEFKKRIVRNVVMKTVLI